MSAVHTRRGKKETRAGAERGVARASPGRGAASRGATNARERRSAVGTLVCHATYFSRKTKFPRPFTPTTLTPHLFFSRNSRHFVTLGVGDIVLSQQYLFPIATGVMGHCPRLERASNAIATIESAMSIRPFYLHTQFLHYFKASNRNLLFLLLLLLPPQSSSSSLLLV